MNAHTKVATDTNNGLPPSLEELLKSVGQTNPHLEGVPEEAKARVQELIDTIEAKGYKVHCAHAVKVPAGMTGLMRDPKQADIYAAIKAVGAEIAARYSMPDKRGAAACLLTKMVDVLVLAPALKVGPKPGEPFAEEFKQLYPRGAKDVFANIFKQCPWKREEHAAIVATCREYFRDSYDLLQAAIVEACGVPFEPESEDVCTPKS